jgi:hypothetical protein
MTWHSVSSAQSAAANLSEKQNLATGSAAMSAGANHDAASKSSITNPGARNALTAVRLFRQRGPDAMCAPGWTTAKIHAEFVVASRKRTICAVPIMSE